MIYLQLFYTFFKIGLFGFGGGYAMLSMIQGEVVTRYDWVSTQEFTDIVAISQSTPGPIGINAATYVVSASPLPVPSVSTPLPMSALRLQEVSGDLSSPPLR